MGADQNRIILPRQSLQEKLKILSRTRIQTGIRFVQHQKLRFMDHRARQTEPLLYAPLRANPPSAPLFPIVRPSPALPAHGRFLPARKFHTMRQKIPDTLSRLSFHKRQRNQAQSRSGFSASEYFFVVRTPSSHRSPPSLFKSPEIMRSVVVFPAPFGPTKP